MAKRNSSIRDLTNGLGEPEKDEGAGESTWRSRRGGGPLKSPLHFMPEIDDDPLRSNIIPFPLPVSGGTVDARYQSLDPSLCFASVMNPREQQLLSMDDPWVAELAHAIKQEGQRDPVLVRPLSNPEGPRFEVIYGTTRLFIAKQLGLPLKAWVAVVPDADARRLARSENKDRRDLSAWEKAIDLKRQLEGIYAGKSHEYIAEHEGISRPNITKLIRLADIDLPILRLLTSPHAISVKSGTQILTVLESFDEGTRQAALDACKARAPYMEAAALLKVLKEQKAVQAAKAIKIDRRKPIVLKTGKGTPGMRVTPHRTEDGQFKIDLFEFSQEDLHGLIDYVKRKKGLV